MKKSELRELIREQVRAILKEAKGIYDKFLDNPEAPTGRAKMLIAKFTKQYGVDASDMAADRYIKSNRLTPEEGYIIKYITKSEVTITSGPGGIKLKLKPGFARSTRNEAVLKEGIKI